MHEHNKRALARMYDMLCGEAIKALHYHDLAQRHTDSHMDEVFEMQWHASRSSVRKIKKLIREIEAGS